ncbi:MAG: hypothetical protein IT360_10180 [Gemmatimonadaceae bacterium]|nr:hypothetical protein [Gemmatimonadaceae bacterium]
MLLVVARRFVWAIAAATTLYGLSTGPCGHREAPPLPPIDRAALASASIDAGHHGHVEHSQESQGAESASHHASQPDGGAAGCHCLGACCCPAPAGLVAARGARGTAEVVRDDVPPARRSGLAPTRAEHLLPPATAPPVLLVAA